MTYFVKSLATATLLSLLALPAYAIDTDPFNIVWAFVGSLSGPSATYGTMDLVGVQQAVDDINQSGGINGKRVILRIYDDVCDPNQAVAVANRVVAQDIHFVIEGSCSDSSIASSKIYAEENIVVINPIVSNPKFTDDGGGPTIFRALYRDDQAIPVLARAIIKRFPDKKLAIVHDKSAFGFVIADGLQKLLNARDVKETLFDSYDPESKDFSALVTRLKEAGAETLFVGGYPAQAAMIARQMKEAGLTAQIVASDLTDNNFWKIAGQAGEGALFVFPPDPMQIKGTAALRATLEKKKQAYNGFTFYAYAAAQVLGTAIRATADDLVKNPAVVIHEKAFDTILGRWRFNDKGDVENVPLVLYIWHDGKYAEVAE